MIYKLQRKPFHYNGVKETKPSTFNFLDLDNCVDFTVRLPIPKRLREVEGTDEENSHLIARDRSRRTEIPIATTRRNPLCHQLLNPGSSPIPRRHIPKQTPTPRRRHIPTPMLRSQQEDRHLISTHDPFRTVPPAPTATGNPFHQ